MKSLNFLFLTAVIIALSLSSCNKDDDTSRLEGTYTFDNISQNNEIYAFERQGGNAIEISEEAVDMSQFDECSQLKIIDDITIISDTRLSYTAYNRWQNYNERGIEESDYSISGDVLEFTFLDEFSNDSRITMKIEGDQLILYTYAIAEQSMSSWSDLQFYYRQTNEVILEDSATNRLSGNEGDQVYIMLYEQRFSR